MLAPPEARWLDSSPRRRRTRRTEELERLIDKAQSIIAERQLPEEQPRREVIERRRGHYGVGYQLEKVKCGRPHCSEERDSAGHGPYWYAYVFRNGRYTSSFLGRRMPEELRQKSEPVET